MPAILALFAAGTLAPPTKAAPRLTFPWLRDMQVTISARRALLEEPALPALNLGVNVRDGVATVWGPIPNDEVGRKAVKRVEAVQGVLKVRSDFYLLGPKKEEELPDSPLVLETPTKSESASPNRESGDIGNLTGRFGPGFPVEPPTVGLQAAVSLLPPVALPDNAATVSASASAPAGDSVTVAIERLRQADQRFRPIASEHKDGAVMLRGGAAAGENVMAFAQAIAQLAGVERVVVLSAGP